MIAPHIYAKLNVYVNAVFPFLSLRSEVLSKANKNKSNNNKNNTLYSQINLSKAHSPQK